MPRQTQAELFIKTLEELLDAEHEIQRARLRRQHKENAERYIQAFPAERDESLVNLEWTGRQDGSRRKGPNLSQAD